ncbi:uncharacterized protein RJT21DRAFT_118388 [Scheffersomyces amazonensis]|uniref:uncharacterized protein n=1 Tax=Scheffersomyces amazonensis TaxID=1078765 RepID=UPI00315C51A8
MIPGSGKLQSKSQNKSRIASTPSPRFVGNNSKSERQRNKDEILKRFQEQTPIDSEEDIFGNNGGTDFTISEELDNFHINVNQLSIPNKKRISPSSNSDSMSISSPKVSIISPAARSGLAVSGLGNVGGSRKITKEDIGIYSEGDDTDITSQLDDDEFEDVDNIFGADESGIYNKINKKLISKQLKLQQESDFEERELMNKRQIQQTTNYSDPNGTLRIKDFQTLNQNYNNTLTDHNLNLLDQLDNERTINYDFIRDDNDNFEDGFDNIDLDTKIVSNNKIIGQSIIRNKASMPAINKKSIQSIRKFQSSADFRSTSEAGQSKGFNHDNKVIRKLDRIPSFYNSRTISEENNQKQILLNKYKEQRLLEKESRRQQRQNQNQNNQEIHRHRMGTIKNMNTNTIVPHPTTTSKGSKMIYNSGERRWEGNEVDLLRFEILHKPSLITLNEIKLDNHITSEVNGEKSNKNPNMVYDKTNLKWVNLEDDNESIFNDIDDLNENKINNYNTIHSTSNYNIFRDSVGYKLGSPPKIPKSFSSQSIKSPTSKRGISQFTQRTISTLTSNTTDSEDEGDTEIANADYYEFNISNKLFEKFQKEEIKILKKTSNWFNHQESYNFTEPNNPVSNEYYWEIRKLVIDNE